MEKLKSIFQSHFLMQNQLQLRFKYYITKLLNLCFQYFFLFLNNHKKLVMNHCYFLCMVIIHFFNNLDNHTSLHYIQD